MNNLAEMVKDTTPEEAPVFSEQNLDLPPEEETENTEVVEAQEEQAQAQNMVPITELVSWFEVNSGSLDNINQVKVSIRGINPDKTIIMAVKDGDETDSEGNDVRKLRVFDDADLTPVLNLPPVAMDIYNSGFRTIHAYSDSIFIKSYGVRTGLICTLCVLIDGKLIPYEVKRIKKKDTDLEVTMDVDIPAIEHKLTEAANVESLQLLYKQSSKASETFTTTQSVIDWLIARQESVTDINHHLQIDNVMIDLLK